MGDSSDDFEDTKVVKKAKKIKKPEKENEPPKDNANEWKPSYNKGNKKATLDDLNRTVESVHPPWFPHFLTNSI